MIYHIISILVSIGAFLLGYNYGLGFPDREVKRLFREYQKTRPRASK